MINYPDNLFFDLETLLNVAQPSSILLLGDADPVFLNPYLEQKSALQKNCSLTTLASTEIDDLDLLTNRFDVGIALNLFENLNKTQGQRILCKLRDVLTTQYCVGLSLNTGDSTSDWQLNDLFAFALDRVASYHGETNNQPAECGLFKYNIMEYKKTPKWLNTKNWANPKMWNKYRW
jgi:hypothetical protein